MKEAKKNILVLWNQVDDDVYESFRDQGPQPVEWNPEQTASEVTTVREEIEGLVVSLREGPFEVVDVNIKDDIDRLIAAIRLHQPDAIFNLVEFFYDDETLEANVAGLYEMFDVAYTGNSPHTLAACQRKVRTKLLLEDAGIPIAPYFVADKPPVPDPSELELTYPLIVKPALEDASGGIEPESVVHDHAALMDRCQYLFDVFEQPAIVEEYIEGREIHAAVIGNDKPEVLPLFEMEFDDSEFNPEGQWRPQIITYSAKWDPHSKEFYSMEPAVPPSDLDPELQARIEAIAVSAYRVMGCRDYARVDMRIDADGEPYVLEVNPNPDLADGSAFMLCAEASGRTYAETLIEIASLALKRRVSETAAEEAPSESTDWMNRKYSKKPTPRACPKCGASLASAPVVSADVPPTNHGGNCEETNSRPASVIP
jgi:D-alanine-D-alanine ligase